VQRLIALGFVMLGSVTWAATADARVYWTGFSSGAVYRANLDGSGFSGNHFIGGGAAPPK